MAIPGDAPSPKNFKQQRYAKLVELGFAADWIDKATLSKPSLWEQPEHTVSFLLSRGFDNPTKLITSLPAILGLAFDNIDRKIRLLQLLHNDRAAAITTVSASPMLLGLKWRQILYAVRATNLATMPRVITLNPNIMTAAIGYANSTNPNQIRKIARELKASDTDLPTLIDAFMRDSRLPPKLVRALSRI